jgi:hypothetical protein
MIVSRAQLVGTGDKPVERHRLRHRQLVRTARADMQARDAGMLSLAEPGLSLEAHRRSPVRSAGTKRDSSRRIAATRRAVQNA